jgi:large subunit ribosomal protein L24
MASKVHVRKDDMVQVIAGDDAEKGKAHKVLRVLPDVGKVVVEGINKVYKHVKPSQRSPQGGRLSKEMPIDASNVLLFCPTCRRGVRIGRRYEANGAKVRFCKKCGANLGAVSKARTKYAKQ